MTTRARGAVVAALTVTGLVVPALLFVAQYPRWWVWIAQEQVPMTWFQSVALVLAGAVSLLAWFVSRTADVTPRSGFALLAVGFAALAFDERFAVHERVRDGVLAPRGVRLPLLTWIAPGDFLLVLVAACGLLLLPLVLRTIRVDRWARTLFGIGVALSLVAVGTDSIDPGSWSVGAERVQQSLEECIELWAGLSYLGAVTLRLMSLVTEHVTPAGIADPAPREGRAATANPAGSANPTPSEDAAGATGGSGAPAEESVR
ncbi:hypothetical protein [Janibacter limosus]|uniref:Uncharacterized protein n=1 Tax=Janibacter limosus TaxID=53458 RepID=A0A4P6MQP9_9MICO|nr:hypothetical protein [Janibacter limosus]QBF45046.1 hypothetical protein EXU32_01445 [Janibacter limosus]